MARALLGFFLDHRVTHPPNSYLRQSYMDMASKLFTFTFTYLNVARPRPLMLVMERPCSRHIMRPQKHTFSCTSTLTNPAALTTTGPSAPLRLRHDGRPALPGQPILTDRHTYRYGPNTGPKLGIGRATAALPALCLYKGLILCKCKCIWK